MKNKVRVFRVILTCFIILSCICTFLPMITVKTIGIETDVSFADMLDTDSLYDLGMDLVGQKDELDLFRIIIIAHLVLNVLICVLIWTKSKFTTVIAMIFGIIQCGCWGLCADAWKSEFAGGNFFFNASVGMGLWGYVDAAVAVVILCIVLLFCDKKKKKDKVKVKAIKEGAIMCLSGEYAGARVVVGKAPIVLGRDKEVCQMIYSGDRISRQHCSISYDADKEMYKIFDFSTNGTFLGKVCTDENRLEREKAILLQPGTVISISKEDCFELQ